MYEQRIQVLMLVFTGESYVFKCLFNIQMLVNNNTVNINVGYVAVLFKITLIKYSKIHLSMCRLQTKL